jgi:hypothetical protein
MYTCCIDLSGLQVMQSTRLGQGAKFFRAEECRDTHGRLQPAPPIVLGHMGADTGGLSSGGAMPKPGQVRLLVPRAREWEEGGLRAVWAPWQLSAKQHGSSFARGCCAGE